MANLSPPNAHTNPYASADVACYVVTDIEADGPQPGHNSMLSFASVATDATGKILHQFEACLNPLEGAVADPNTLTWFQTQPDAWAHATCDPKPPLDVMRAYVNWLRQLPAPRLFTAHPLGFDGVWMDWYLQKFVALPLVSAPSPETPLFAGGGLDLQTLIMGVMGWDYARCRRQFYPEEWFGGYAHTHRALDDAMGYAHVLGRILRIRRERVC